MLEEGLEVEEMNTAGRTALVLAAKFGHLPAVETLLDVGADVNHTDHDRKSAIAYAIEQKHGDIARLLKLNGADYCKCKECDDVMAETPVTPSPAYGGFNDPPSNTYTRRPYS